MKGEIGDKARLLHILDAIEEVEAYAKDCSFDVFANNSMMQFASIKQIEIIEKDIPELREQIIRILDNFSDMDGEPL